MIGSKRRVCSAALRRGRPRPRPRTWWASPHFGGEVVANAPNANAPFAPSSHNQELPGHPWGRSLLFYQGARPPAGSARRTRLSPHPRMMNGEAQAP